MPLVRCRVREGRDVRTTRISHVVTDSTRRTNIEYSIRTKWGVRWEKVGGRVRRWSLGCQVMDLVGRPETRGREPAVQGQNLDMPAVVRSRSGSARTPTPL